METNLINDIAICIVVAWGLAVTAQLLKQPLLLAYLVAGFVVGPVGLGWIRAHSIETISEMGLILLLFMIGLEIDLKKILDSGRIILLTASIQILGGCGLGLILINSLRGYLGVSRLEALYLAVALALSSTVIIVKILYDKRELDTLVGRITVGVLVLQDLSAVLFLAIQPNLTEPAVGMLAWSIGKVIFLTGVAFIASRYALPPLFNAVARLPELVQVGALAWCFLVAGLASVLGLSREMGALIAGVAISTYPYTLDVTAKVTSLRDFFVTLFFVALGMAIPAPSGYFVGWAIVLALFLIGSRFLTLLLPLYRMRQGHRTSLLVSLYLSQVSEFSLVILALGLQANHLTRKTTGIAAYTFVFLAVLSTYAMGQPDSFLRWASSWLKRIGLPDLDQANRTLPQDRPPPDIFLLGFFRTASSLLEAIERKTPDRLARLVVIDFNPQVYARLQARGIRVIYGDIGRRETLIHADVGQAKIIVSTLPDMLLKGTNNLRLLQQLREINPTAQIIMHAELLTEVPGLYAAGADYVSVPRLLEATELCSILEAALQNRLGLRRTELDRELINRQETIP